MGKDEEEEEKVRPRLSRTATSLAQNRGKGEKNLLNTSCTLNTELGSKGGSAETLQAGRDIFQRFSSRLTTSSPSPACGSAKISTPGRNCSQQTRQKQVKTLYLALTPVVLPAVHGTHLKVNLGTSISHTSIPASNLL